MRILTDFVYRVIEILSAQTRSFVLLAKLFQGVPNLSKNRSQLRGNQPRALNTNNVPKFTYFTHIDSRLSGPEEVVHSKDIAQHPTRALPSSSADKQ